MNRFAGFSGRGQRCRDFWDSSLHENLLIATHAMFIVNMLLTVRTNVFIVQKYCFGNCQIQIIARPNL